MPEGLTVQIRTFWGAVEKTDDCRYYEWVIPGFLITDHPHYGFTETLPLKRIGDTYETEALMDKYQAGHCKWAFGAIAAAMPDWPEDRYEVIMVPHDLITGVWPIDVTCGDVPGPRTVNCQTVKRSGPPGMQPARGVREIRVDFHRQ